MIELLYDAFIDAAKMLPFLLIIYIAIELFEYKYGNRLRQNLQKAGAAGPFIGAIAGIFPQCGFSVIATALYTQRLATLGTLLAVYLSTSDEALPIILSRPENSFIILPLILTKLSIAIIAGYAVDFAFKKYNQKTLQHIKSYNSGTDDKKHHHETVLEESACCGHSTSSESKKFNSREIFFHPLIHTAKIFIFIFAITFIINLLISRIGANKIGEFFFAHKLFQPFFAALVGLIPNCAASVAITEFYLKELITYGAAIAGLCASGGLGILVLLKEEENKKNAFFIIALLFIISVISGLIIEI